MIAIDNAEIVVRHIIGADCTFSHNERHKVLKGYVEVDNKENDEISERNMKMWEELLKAESEE